MERIAGSCTNHRVDRDRHGLLLNAFKGRPGYDALRARILAGRADWLAWTTMTQRKWQATTSRRPQRNRHADSWSIRERYVRCGEGGAR